MVTNFIHHSGRVTALITAVSASLLGRVGIFNNLKERFLLGNRKEDGAELQSPVYIPNIPGLNPKSLLSAYEVKAYVILSVIHLLDGDVRPGSPLDAFRRVV